MSNDLGAAIEAASLALIAVTEDDNSPCLDDEQDCYRIHPVHFAWYQLGETGVLGETKAIARTVLGAAASLIEADVRRKIAEDGTRLLRNLLTEHLLTNGKCFPSQCGDPDDVIWSDHIADLWAAAIARGDSGGQA